MIKNQYQIGNAIVYVSRPVLTAAERSRREGVILTTLQQYGKATQKRKEVTTKCTESVRH